MRQRALSLQAQFSKSLAMDRTLAKRRLTTLHTKKPEHFVISSYTGFDNIGHQPSGKESPNGLHVFRFNQGSLVLVHQNGFDLTNPGFVLFDDKKDMLYTCTETDSEDGKLCAFKLDQSTGMLTGVGPRVDSKGRATCYLSFDKNRSRLLAASYINGKIASVPICQTGILHENDSNYSLPTHHDYDYINKTKESHKPRSFINDQGIDQSLPGPNNDQILLQRLGETNAHAVLLDPYYGKIGYVADLGMNVIREYHYDNINGRLKHNCIVQYSPGSDQDAAAVAHGPRHLVFHPTLPVLFVVNELSSTLSSFRVDAKLLGDITESDSTSTLRHMQTISTIPDGFSTALTTCAAIKVHPSGRFVLVSNRGHDSLGVFHINVDSDSDKVDDMSIDYDLKLELVDIVHTEGSTPRSFEFDSTGQYVMVCNQDSDNVVVFSFDNNTGRLQYTGNCYHVSCPNHITSCAST